MSDPKKWTTECRPQKMDDRMSGPKNGRPKVGPKNWMTEGRPLKMDDGRSAP